MSVFCRFVIGSLFFLASYSYGNPPLRLIDALIRSGKTEGTVMKVLTQEIQSLPAASLQILNNDPLYQFSNGNLNRELIEQLNERSQALLVQVLSQKLAGKLRADPVVVQELKWSQNYLKPSGNLGVGGKVSAGVSQEDLLRIRLEEAKVSAQPKQEFLKEVIELKNDTGVFIADPKLCKSYDDELTKGHTAFIKKFKKTFSQTRSQCPAKLYAAFAEASVFFQLGMGRSGAKAFEFAKGFQVCFTRSDMRNQVINEINRFQSALGSKAINWSESRSCPVFTK